MKALCEGFAEDEAQTVSPGRSMSRPARGRLRRARWLLLLLLLALPGGAQYGSLLQDSQQSIMRQMGSQGARAGVDLDPPDPFQGERQLRLLNAERQKSLVADARKLLILARELNAECGASSGSSAEQLRKVAEIEKLAHNVKEKMSTSVRSGPAWLSPIIIPTR